MKIGAISQVNYNKLAKTSFRKNNSVAPSINNQEFTIPNLNQTQVFSGVRFSGDRDIQDLYNDKTSDKNISAKEQNSSASSALEPEMIEAFTEILNSITSEQIKIFTNTLMELMDEVPKIIAEILTPQDEDENIPLDTTSTGAVAEYPDRKEVTKLNRNNTDNIEASAKASEEKATVTKDNKITEPATSKSALLKRCFFERTSIEDIREVFGSNPDELEEFILEERDYPVLNLATPEQIQVFSEILGDRAPEIMEKALPIQSKDSITPPDGANFDETKASCKAPGDKASETFTKVLAIENKDKNASLYSPSTDTVAKHSDTRITTSLDKNRPDNNKTAKPATSKSALLKRCFFERTSIEDIREVFGSNPDELEKFILEERDYPVLNLATPEQIQVFSEILGNRAPKIIEKALPIQSISGKTPLHDPNYNKVEAFAWILNDKAPEIFANLLTAQDKDGNTPLHWAGPYKIKAIVKALGDKAPEVFTKVLAIQNKDGDTPLHLTSADGDSIFIKALGDKAPEILPKLLVIQNKDGNTPLHLAGPHSIEVYAKALGTDTDKIFDKILLIKNNHGKLAIYPSGCHPDKLITLNNVAPNATKRALKEKYGSETLKDIWVRELKDKCDTYNKFLQQPRLVWFNGMDDKVNYNSWKKFLDELAKQED